MAALPRHDPDSATPPFLATTGAAWAESCEIARAYGALDRVNERDHAARAVMGGYRKFPVRLRSWRVLVPLWALFAALAPDAFAAEPTTLDVRTASGLPGFYHSALARFIAWNMAKAGLADWSFEPATGNGTAADRVEWSFTWNPCACGEVRSFTHALNSEAALSGRRPITIEARLYLQGEYWTLVEKQAAIRGGPDDPDLAAAVVSATRNLLGPTGAYRAIDMGQYRTDHEVGLLRRTGK
jgi:hypothetical protein